MLVCPSRAPGSLKPPLKSTVCSGTSTNDACEAPLMRAVGVTLAPLIATAEVAPFPPSSTAVSVATNVPSSSGVTLMVGPVPIPNGLPFLVTFQVYVNEVSAGLGLMALPVNVMGVPSGPLAGAPVIETVGGTPAIGTVKDVV